MRTKIPTGRMTPVSGASVRLLVDYDNAADLLDDYVENLVRLECVVETERVVPVGTHVRLGLAFPGLIEPIVLDGVVSPPLDGVASTSTRVQLLASESSRLGEVVERIRANDQRLIVRFVRVLIAEDNTHVSELVTRGLATATRRELRDMTFGFDTACDGAAALELLRQQQFDAAIIDIYLPVLDGAALIRHIRTTLGQPRMPVIALSGGGDAARDVGLRAGASTFLEKPVRLRSIVETLRQLIKV